MTRNFVDSLIEMGVKVARVFDAAAASVKLFAFASWESVEVAVVVE